VHRAWRPTTCFLCHGFGFRFAPRIRDLGNRRLYVPYRRGVYPALAPFIAEPIRVTSVTHIRTQWNEVRRSSAERPRARTT
jgi:TnpA family transposase